MASGVGTRFVPYHMVIHFMENARFFFFHHIRDFDNCSSSASLLDTPTDLSMSLKEFATAAEITRFPIDLRVSLGDLGVKCWYIYQRWARYWSRPIMPIRLDIGLIAFPSVHPMHVLGLQFSERRPNDFYHHHAVALIGRFPYLCSA